MKKITLSIILLLSIFMNVFAHVDHYKEFNYLEYELFRNDKLIGYHKYDFSTEDGKLIVKSIVDFKITKLGVDLYKYFAESEEVYKNSKFYAFSSKTNQNKKQKWVNINLDEQKNILKIEGYKKKLTAPIDYVIGTWWNHEIVKSTAQISAISGRIIDQDVTFLGKETIKIGNKSFKTLHFNFKSSDTTLPDNKKLNTDIWYEENSYLWVKASFTKQGKWEYRLKNYN